MRPALLLLPLLAFGADPYETWDRYVGTIGGKYAITLDLSSRHRDTLRTLEGRYHYDKHGTGIMVHGELKGDQIVMEGFPDGWATEKFTGRMLGRDTLKGTWSQYDTSEGRDPRTGTYLKEKLGKSFPFRLVRTSEGSVPLRFDTCGRENDSTARANLRSGKIEAPWDTMPSRHFLSSVAIDRPGDPIADSINRQIGRAILAEYKGYGFKFPKGAWDFRLALAAFDRDWKESAGAYFSFIYSCEVVGNERGILSIKFDRFDFAGQARPNSYHRFETYDVRTGKRLRLEDLLEPKALPAIAAMAGEPTCSGAVGHLPCAHENGFGISHDAIELRVGYEDRSVRIPFPAVARYVKRDGPLAPFLRPAPAKSGSRL